MVHMLIFLLVNYNFIWILHKISSMCTPLVSPFTSQYFCIPCAGIKSCSHHALSGSSSQSLCANVALQFIPFLQQEGKQLHLHWTSGKKKRVNVLLILWFFVIVHEGTLVHAVSVMSRWLECLNVEVPVALRDWFKKAFALKSSTSSVRNAYLQAMLRAFKGQ